MVLTDQEIAGLFNYIRLVGSVLQNKADLAGMWFYGTYQTVRGGTRRDNIYTITRLADFMDHPQEHPYPWSIEFMVTDLTDDQMANGDYVRVHTFRHVSRPGGIKVLRINGDYDAFMKDAALIRMFSSVFEDALTNV